MPAPQNKPPRRIVISLGSNLGDRSVNIQKAIHELRGLRLEAIRVSPIFDTVPLDYLDQPDFLNAILIGESTETAPALLEQVLAIENKLGRERTIPKGPRTIDIDLIAIGDEVWNTESLTLPHPRAHERAFVLIPWLALEPAAELPGYGRIADLFDSSKQEDIKYYHGLETSLISDI